MYKLFVSTIALGIALSAANQGWAEDNTECFPPCRTGYLCYKGECVSRCNPPCPAGQKCTDEGECVLNQPSQQPSSGETMHRKSLARKNLPSNEVFIVRPDMKPELVPGSYEDDELLSAANMVVDAIMSSVSAPSAIIAVDELPSVEKCSGRLIVIRVKSYHKEPARMGQYEGVVTVSIESYNQIGQESPARVDQFTAKGGRHWGDSVPLENAFEAVSKKIRRNYGN